jgi:hypothetical protein
MTEVGGLQMRSSAAIGAQQHQRVTVGGDRQVPGTRLWSRPSESSPVTRPGSNSHNSTLPRPPPLAARPRSNPTATTTIGVWTRIQPCLEHHRRRPDHDPTLSPPPPSAPRPGSNPVAPATVGARTRIQPCRAHHRRRPDQAPTPSHRPPSAPRSGSNPVPPTTAGARTRIQPCRAHHRRLDTAPPSLGHPPRASRPASCGRRSPPRTLALCRARAHGCGALGRGARLGRGVWLVRSRQPQRLAQRKLRGRRPRRSLDVAADYGG